MRRPTRGARRVITTAALAWAVVACKDGGGAGGHDGGAHDASSDGSGDGPTDAGAAPANEAGQGQVDRAGRPLVSVLLVPGVLQDDYNAAPTFDTPLSRTLEEALSSRLAVFDTIALNDGGIDPVDWPIEGGMHPLAPVLAADALLVDTTLPCVSADGGFAASYLDIEREAFPDVFQSDAGHTTCGGRTPSDDVVDTTLALLITRNRDGGPQVSQGVAGPTKPATATFPYLAEP
jgi:Domain of unknown function (DUF4331)